jgi:hypothetical protein
MPPLKHTPPCCGGLALDSAPSPLHIHNLELDLGINSLCGHALLKYDKINIINKLTNIAGQFFH